VAGKGVGYVKSAYDNGVNSVKRFAMSR